MLPFVRMLEYGNIAPVPVVQKYKKIVSTFENTMILENSGDLYSFGISTYGEIGPSSNVKQLMSAGVENFWLNNRNSLYHTYDGRYIFNGYGASIGLAATGFTNYDFTNSLHSVISDEDIKKIEMGWYCMYVLTTSGDLYGIGIDNSGQLMGEGNLTVLTRLTSGILDIKCNNNNGLFALKNDGKIYACGSSSSIGVNKSGGAVNVLTPLSLPNGVVDIYTELSNDILSVNRTGTVLFSPSTQKLYSTGYVGGAFNNNTTTMANIYTFIEVKMNDGNSNLIYRGKMFGSAGDPRFSAILMSREDNSAYGYYFSADNSTGCYGIGNTVFQRYMQLSAISSDAKLMCSSRGAWYYAYDDNFLAAGDASANYSIPGYSGIQSTFVVPNGF